MSGSAIALNWAKENANAILQAWYPGEEGGTAIAQTLDGTNNPSGRLPVTVYTGVDQLPEFTDYSMARRTYRYFDGQPLFPFGHGLSYSTFAYSEPEGAGDGRGRRAAAGRGAGGEHRRPRRATRWCRST